MFNPFKKKVNENDDWKDKAKNRRKENEKLKKRNNELKNSRNKWKSKANKHQRKIDELNEILKKKLLNQKLNRPKRYWFSVDIIFIILKNKLSTSTSFRALSISFGIYISSLNLDCKQPTHTTLLNWVHKIGYYELTRKKEKGDDWVIIIDESIQLGQDKVLVILGIREKNIDFTRPLQFQDLVPLREISKTKWTGEVIKDVLIDLENELGSIKYAVGDYASQLKKALSLVTIPHVHDLTHKIALFLEKRYKKNPDYINLIKNMTDMRIKYSQTNIAHIIPPKQRKKSRYQNVKIISDWSIKSLRYLDESNNINDDVYEKLKWIMDYRKFICDLSELNQKINIIEKLLKHNGFSIEVRNTCLDELKSVTSSIGVEFRNYLIKYFSETEKLLPNNKKILISSDIIESAFGKYKNYLSQNAMAGVTNLILCISAFTATLSEENIKEALEKTTINDVRKWTRKFVGKTLLQRRKEILCFN